MNANLNTIGALIKRPSAFVPIIMSLAALGVVLGHFAMYGDCAWSGRGRGGAYFLVADGFAGAHNNIFLR
jgi:hypothetical protein